MRWLTRPTTRAARCTRRSRERGGAPLLMMRAEPKLPSGVVTAGQEIGTEMHELAYEDKVAFLMVSQMGGDSRAYARERRQASRRLVAEVYSPPRVAALIKSMPSCGLLPGSRWT